MRFIVDEQFVRRLSEGGYSSLSLGLLKTNKIKPSQYRERIIKDSVFNQKLFLVSSSGSSKELLNKRLRLLISDTNPQVITVDSNGNILPVAYLTTNFDDSGKEILTGSISDSSIAPVPAQFDDPAFHTSFVLSLMKKGDAINNGFAYSDTPVSDTLHQDADDMEIFQKLGFQPNTDGSDEEKANSLPVFTAIPTTFPLARGDPTLEGASTKDFNNLTDQFVSLDENGNVIGSSIPDRMLLWLHSTCLLTKWNDGKSLHACTGSLKTTLSDGTLLDEVPIKTNNITLPPFVPLVDSIKLPQGQPKMIPLTEDLYAVTMERFDTKNRTFYAQQPSVDNTQGSPSDHQSAANPTAPLARDDVLQAFLAAATTNRTTTTPPTDEPKRGFAQSFYEYFFAHVETSDDGQHKVVVPATLTKAATDLLSPQKGHSSNAELRRRLSMMLMKAASDQSHSIDGQPNLINLSQDPASFADDSLRTTLCSASFAQEGQDFLPGNRSSNQLFNMTHLLPNTPAMMLQRRARVEKQHKADQLFAGNVDKSKIPTLDTHLLARTDDISTHDVLAAFGNLQCLVLGFTDELFREKRTPTVMVALGKMASFLNIGRGSRWFTNRSHEDPKFPYFILQQMNMIFMGTVAIARLYEELSTTDPTTPLDPEPLLGLLHQAETIVRTVWSPASFMGIFPAEFNRNQRLNGYALPPTQQTQDPDRTNPNTRRNAPPTGNNGSNRNGNHADNNHTSRPFTNHVGLVQARGGNPPPRSIPHPSNVWVAENADGTGRKKQLCSNYLLKGRGCTIPNCRRHHLASMHELDPGNRQTFKNWMTDHSLELVRNTRFNTNAAATTSRPGASRTNSNAGA